jgi:hypothetical protein
MTAQPDHVGYGERTLHVTSEEDAYTFLEQIESGSTPVFSKIVFDGWPSLDLFIRGDRFHQSITPSVMKGLLEFQAGLYKSYASARYGVSSKRLTDAEREQLEIRIDVNNGSSLLGINLTQIANHIVDQLSEILPPHEVAILVVGLLVVFSGSSAYKTHLEERRKVQIEQLRNDSQKQLLEALTYQSEQETKRAEIITRLTERDERASQIVQAATDAQHGIIRSLSAGDSGGIGESIVLSKDVSRILASSPRRKAKEVRLDGEYKIKRVDWSTLGVFKVKIQSVDSGLQLDAEVQDDSLDGKHKEAIKFAEWSRRSVKLQVNARRFGDDDFKDVIIVSAYSVDQDPAAWTQATANNDA